ncbi:MAG TPA: hypothetical protein VD970_18065 [Acetobacteraceae bacterium]|nr:hypothetical protein [Acetobacteraceae bacterium]
MSDAFEAAQAALASQGLRGRLEMVIPTLWQLRGEIGTKGAAVEFDGEPDEALLNEASRQIRASLEG